MRRPHIFVDSFIGQRTGGHDSVELVGRVAYSHDYRSYESLASIAEFDWEPFRVLFFSDHPL